MKHPFMVTIFILTLFLIGCEQNTVTPTVDNSSKTLYVLNGSAETVSKVNMEDLSIAQDITITGTIPNRIRVYDDRVYVVSSGDDNIKIIDPKDDTKILSTIGLDAGSNPWDILFVNNSKAYVTNYNTNSVSILDLSSNSVVGSIMVGLAPEGMAYKDGLLYVANTGYSGWGQPFINSSISIIDISTDKVIETISTPINPQDLSFAPDGTLHVICSGDYGAAVGKVAIIDVNQNAVVDSVIIGGSPGDIEITKDGIGYCIAWGDGTNGFLYAYNAIDKTIINNSDDPIRVGPNTSQLTYDFDENVLWIPYMAEWAGDGFIQKFDVTTNSVVWTSAVVGNGSSAVAVYVTNN